MSVFFTCSFIQRPVYIINSADNTSFGYIRLRLKYSDDYLKHSQELVYHYLLLFLNGIYLNLLLKCPVTWLRAKQSASKEAEHC